MIMQTKTHPRRALMLALGMDLNEARDLCALAEVGRYIEPDDLSAARMVADWNETTPSAPVFV